ncbi:death-associated inhibitor of apoptosis 2-like [Penaeus japonicus]|uniref:death-associated inhibitor of apoptosis 2-like n=1 Tax=Penaeus japonicus TaxID=27405 RepID=UPI001C715A45|nr:death-associated inhibitor of apoptosis 2-like [Penaeus japonicus]
MKKEESYIISWCIYFSRRAYNGNIDKRVDHVLLVVMCLLNISIAMTGDTIACAFCYEVMSNFNEGDIPKEIHDNKYRHCPTLRENYVFDPDFLLKTEGENIDPLKSIPIIRSYTATSRRLKSFNNWPEYVIKKPQDLAEAGFLSRNISDHVRCFYCGGCLRNWKKAVNNISDQDMGILMELDIVKNVIAMGYPVSVIKYTLKNHIKQAGWPYLREEPFINDITKVQATNNGDSTDVSETSITLLSSRHTSSPPFSPISSRTGTE